MGAHHLSACLELLKSFQSHIIPKVNIKDKNGFRISHQEVRRPGLHRLRRPAIHPPPREAPLPHPPRHRRLLALRREEVPRRREMEAGLPHRRHWRHGRPRMQVVRVRRLRWSLSRPTFPSSPTQRTTVAILSCPSSCRPSTCPTSTSSPTSASTTSSKRVSSSATRTVPSSGSLGPLPPCRPSSARLTRSASSPFRPSRALATPA